MANLRKKCVIIRKYRGAHGNLRLWRECKSQQFLEAVALFSLKQEAPASVGGGTVT